MAGIAEVYASVRAPIVVANALDDARAMPAFREAFVAGYVNAPLERRDIGSARFRRCDQTHGLLPSDLRVRCGPMHSASS